MNGVINIRKERGCTSFDVVARMRGILKQRRIGHTGTLDPEAEGVLPVCVGSATKACGLLTEKDKTYEAVLRLGLETDTQDMTGTVQKTCPVAVSEAEVRAAAMSFVGIYLQTPPMYSAVRVGGKRLYELAREGKVIDRSPRPVTIYALELQEIALGGEENEVRFTVTCSRGTYIRTLCEDIGRRLGCGGCMKSLRRTRVSSFELSDSITLAKLEALRDAGRLAEAVLPVDRLFSDFPALYTTKEGDPYLCNGNKLPINMVRPAEGFVLSVGRDGATVLTAGDTGNSTGAEDIVQKAVSTAEKAGSCTGSEDIVQKAVNSARDRDAEESARGDTAESEARCWYRVYDSCGCFYALYKYNEEEKVFRTVKMFIPE